MLRLVRRLAGEELHLEGYQSREQFCSPEQMVTETISVSDTDFVKKSQDLKLLVTLVGRMSPASPPPDLTGSVLLVPSEPVAFAESHADKRWWPLVPLAMFTADGSECDKIGVS